MKTIDIIAEAASRKISLHNWSKSLFDNTPSGVVYLYEASRGPHEIGDIDIVNTQLIELTKVNFVRYGITLLFNDNSWIYAFKPTVNLEIFDPWKTSQEDLDTIVRLVSLAARPHLKRLGLKSKRRYQITDFLPSGVFNNTEINNLLFRYLRQILIKSGYNGMYAGDPVARGRECYIFLPSWIKYIDSRQKVEHGWGTVEREWPERRAWSFVRRMQKYPNEVKSIFDSLPETVRDDIVRRINAWELSGKVSYEIYKNFPKYRREILGAFRSKYEDYSKFYEFLDSMFTDPGVANEDIARLVEYLVRLGPSKGFVHIFKSISEGKYKNIEFSQIIEFVLLSDTPDPHKEETLRQLSSFQGKIFLDNLEKWEQTIPEFSKFKLSLISGAMEYYETKNLSKSPEYKKLYWLKRGEFDRERYERDRLINDILNRQR